VPADRSANPARDRQSLLGLAMDCHARSGACRTGLVSRKICPYDNLASLRDAIDLLHPPFPAALVPGTAPTTRMHALAQRRTSSQDTPPGWPVCGKPAVSPTARQAPTPSAMRPWAPGSGTVRAADGGGTGHGRRRKRPRTGPVGAVIPTVPPGFSPLTCHFRMRAYCPRLPGGMINEYRPVTQPESDCRRPQAQDRSSSRKVADPRLCECKNRLIVSEGVAVVPQRS
jgi:hypothetical protein